MADVLAAAPERFVLCGYSMGGRIALHVALAAPERVERLVLVATTAGIADDASARPAARDDERLAAFADARDASSSSPTAGPRSRSSPARRPRPRASGARTSLRNDPRALAAVLRGIGTGAMEPLWERLRTLTMPATVVAGDRDPKFVALGERLAPRCRTPTSWSSRRRARPPARGAAGAWRRSSRAHEAARRRHRRVVSRPRRRVWWRRRRGQAPALSADSRSSGSAADRRPQGRDLTVRQAIGQHMVFAYAGTRPPRALERRIARGRGGGRDPVRPQRPLGRAGLGATVARLQAIKRPARSTPRCSSWSTRRAGSSAACPARLPPSAAATPSAVAARANGRAAGQLLHRAGVTVDLAPVVDVGRADRALANEGRTYDDDVSGVIARAGAFADGLRAAGIEPVLKHFPGFGAASVNTDDGAARIDLSLSQLRAVDLQPYAKIETRAVMLSTAIYPQVDPRPAAFSQRWVTGELRGRLRFTGVAMTDDLQTPAVARFGTPAPAARSSRSRPASTCRSSPRTTRRVRVPRPAWSARCAAARCTRSRVDTGAGRVLRWRFGLG